jgi:hypothetical protein
MAVAIEELRQTVERMERKLAADGGDGARELMRVYSALLPRFATDLRDERDELLTRGGALMLIQEALAQQNAT